MANSTTLDLGAIHIPLLYQFNCVTPSEFAIDQENILREQVIYALRCKKCHSKGNVAVHVGRAGSRKKQRSIRQRLLSHTRTPNKPFLKALLKNEGFKGLKKKVYKEMRKGDPNCYLQDSYTHFNFFHFSEKSTPSMEQIMENMQLFILERLHAAQFDNEYEKSLIEDYRSTRERYWKNLLKSQNYDFKNRVMGLNKLPNAGILG